MFALRREEHADESRKGGAGRRSATRSCAPRQNLGTHEVDVLSSLVECELHGLAHLWLRIVSMHDQPVKRTLADAERRTLGAVRGVLSLIWSAVLISGSLCRCSSGQEASWSSERPARCEDGRGGWAERAVPGQYNSPRIRFQPELYSAALARARKLTRARLSCIRLCALVLPVTPAHSARVAPAAVVAAHCTSSLLAVSLLV